MEFTVRANFSCSNSGVSRATKKVRTRSDLSLESKDLTVDGNEKKIQGSELPKASYKSTLMGASPNPSQNMFMEEDFPFIDGDVMEVIEGVPPITFSDRNEIAFQVVWIHLSGLPEGFYSSYLLKEIGQAVGMVVKLDIHTGYTRRGRFARLVICVNLRKTLVSKVRINGQLQHVEYESLLDVCFRCGHYDHRADL
ncbi:hypothetical protein GOBAR_DD33980 [Gossypium barbadense]|nr:hypothetical protein GOBAR_DD33980 [Gossypium barbadense]